MPISTIVVELNGADPFHFETYGVQNLNVIKIDYDEAAQDQNYVVSTCKDIIASGLSYERKLWYITNIIEAAKDEY